MAGRNKDFDCLDNQTHKRKNNPCTNGAGVLERGDETHGSNC